MCLFCVKCLCGLLHMRMRYIICIIWHHAFLFSVSSNKTNRSPNNMRRNCLTGDQTMCRAIHGMCRAIHGIVNHLCQRWKHNCRAIHGIQSHFLATDTALFNDLWTFFAAAFISSVSTTMSPGPSSGQLSNSC